MRSFLACALVSAAALSTGCEGKYPWSKDPVPAAEKRARFMTAAKELLLLRVEFDRHAAAAKIALEDNKEAAFRDALTKLRVNLEAQAKHLKEVREVTESDEVRSKSKQELKRVESQVAEAEEMEATYVRAAQERAWATAER